MFYLIKKNKKNKYINYDINDINDIIALRNKNF